MPRRLNFSPALRIIIRPRLPRCPRPLPLRPARKTILILPRISINKTRPVQLIHRQQNIRPGNLRRLRIKIRSHLKPQFNPIKNQRPRLRQRLNRITHNSRSSEKPPPQRNIPLMKRLSKLIPAGPINRQKGHRKNISPLRPRRPRGPKRLPERIRNSRLRLRITTVHRPPVRRNRMQRQRTNIQHPRPQLRRRNLQQVHRKPAAVPTFSHILLHPRPPGITPLLKIILMPLIKNPRPHSKRPRKNPNQRQTMLISFHHPVRNRNTLQVKRKNIPPAQPLPLHTTPRQIIHLQRFLRGAPLPFRTTGHFNQEIQPPPHLPLISRPCLQFTQTQLRRNRTPPKLVNGKPYVVISIILIDQCHSQPESYILSKLPADQSRRSRLKKSDAPSVILEHS